MRRLCLGPLAAVQRAPSAWAEMCLWALASSTAAVSRRANSSLSSSSSSSSASSSASSTARRTRSMTSSSSSSRDRVDAVGSGVDKDDAQQDDTVWNQPSAVDRLAQRHSTSLPWEARTAAVSYDVCASDWKFLDRALSALMEMSAGEVSARSLKLSGRDLLKDVVHPVSAARKASKAKAKLTRSPRRATQSATTATSRTCADESERPKDDGSTCAVPLGVVVASKAARMAASDVPGSQKPRRRGKRTTVRL